MNISLPANIAMTRIAFPNARYLDVVGVVRSFVDCMNAAANAFEGGVDIITALFLFDVIFR